MKRMRAEDGEDEEEGEELWEVAKDACMYGA